MIRETISTLALLAIAGTSVGAQDYGNRLGQGHGEDVQFPTTGPSILSDALDPRVQKWYLSQELYSEYRLNQWSYTNYARDFYLRYLQPGLEGGLLLRSLWPPHHARVVDLRGEKRTTPGLRGQQPAQVPALR